MTIGVIPCAFKGQAHSSGRSLLPTLNATAR